ncbi:hypothetical protein NE237_001936 [Protea cynaroides]|uniref:Stress-associated endoplasmic reticulum protein n=1 Tax=Protea cynaroides TaxID=273540 RepID=A0A9Q0QYZ3_9MAGN|nr:hypothetical protein NE237_001936 [Protea cynaroides]
MLSKELKSIFIFKGSSRGIAVCRAARNSVSAKVENLRFSSSYLYSETKKMTTSRRLADKKVAKFQKNITRRGSVPETSVKKGYDYPVGPIVLGFFVFVVIGSSLFQIIRMATSGGLA